MFCSTCGNSISNDAAFCSRCGCARPIDGVRGLDGATFNPNFAATAREPFSFARSWRAFQSFWTFKNWEKRATRTEYWSFFLWKFVFQAAFSVVFGLGMIGTLMFVAASNAAVSSNAPVAFSSFAYLAALGVYSLLFSLAFLVPTLAATIRRLRDAGANAAFALFIFIPNLSFFATLVIGLLDPTPGANEYGPDPRRVPVPSAPVQTPSTPEQSPEQSPEPTQSAAENVATPTDVDESKQE